MDGKIEKSRQDPVRIAQAWRHSKLVTGGVEEPELLRHVRQGLAGADLADGEFEDRARDGDAHVAELTPVTLPERGIGRCIGRESAAACFRQGLLR